MEMDEMLGCGRRLGRIFFRRFLGLDLGFVDVALDRFLHRVAKILAKAGEVLFVAAARRSDDHATGVMPRPEDAEYFSRM